MRTNYRLVRAGLTAALFAAVLLTSSMVSAQEKEREWYGDYMIAADLLPITLVGIGLSINHEFGTPEGWILGNLASWVTGPLVHGLHGQSRDAWRSFGLRALLPLVLGLPLSLLREALGFDSMAARYSVFAVPWLGALIFDWTELAFRAAETTETMQQGLMLGWQF